MSTTSRSPGRAPSTAIGPLQHVHVLQRGVADVLGGVVVVDRTVEPLPAVHPEGVARPDGDRGRHVGVPAVVPHVQLVGERLGRVEREDEFGHGGLLRWGGTRAGTGSGRVGGRVGGGRRWGRRWRRRRVGPDPGGVVGERGRAVRGGGAGAGAGRSRGVRDRPAAGTEETTPGSLALRAVRSSRARARALPRASRGAVSTRRAGSPQSGQATACGAVPIGHDASSGPSWSQR